MTRFTPSHLIALAAALATLSSVRAGELIQNGGFEDGVYSHGGNGNVPDDWTENAAFDSETGFNEVVSYDPYQGDHDLSIGNFDDQTIPTVSQTFNDVSGDNYVVTFELMYGGGHDGDPGASFAATVGSSGVSLNDSIANGWNEETFDFIGTGHDTLTLGGDTNPSEWFVDAVSVQGVAAAPDSGATAVLLAAGLAGLAIARRRIALS